MERGAAVRAGIHRSGLHLPDPVLPQRRPRIELDRLRWIVWGNLAFTGTLLLATFWHIDEFNWSQFTPPTAHIWVILYIFEPVVMIYLIPRGALRAEAPLSGGAPNLCSSGSPS